MPFWDGADESAEHTAAILEFHVRHVGNMICSQLICKSESRVMPMPTIDDTLVVHRIDASASEHFSSGVRVGHHCLPMHLYPYIHIYIYICNCFFFGPYRPWPLPEV